jgi:polyisoprenoid-binding protein YceI
MSQGSDVAVLLANDAVVGSWVLDPERSRVEFHVKHFWGAVTVHGSFGHITGEGIVGSDGSIQGRLSIDAGSLSTKMKKRDEHLRSPDFFDVEHHPQVAVTLTSAVPSGPTTLAGHGTLDAAGHVQAIDFSIDVAEADPEGVILRVEILIDRTEFAMTWSPLGMASKVARVLVVGRFVRP